MNHGRKTRYGLPAQDDSPGINEFSFFTPAQLKAWQCFWVCPRCGNEKAMKFKEDDRTWIECVECEYYEEVKE